MTSELRCWDNGHVLGECSRQGSCPPMQREGTRNTEHRAGLYAIAHTGPTQPTRETKTIIPIVVCRHFVGPVRRRARAASRSEFGNSVSNASNAWERKRRLEAMTNIGILPNARSLLATPLHRAPSQARVAKQECNCCQQASVRSILTSPSPTSLTSRCKAHKARTRDSHVFCAP